MNTAKTVDRSACTAKRHGDESAYSWWRCRCPDSREAWRLYKKRLREGRHISPMIDATGTTRRMRALVAHGYCWADLARRLDISPRRAADLGKGDQQAVYVGTAAKVAAIYDRLSVRPGPSKYALIVAGRHGWIGPDGWDDDAIDDPATQPYADKPDPVDVIDEVAIQQVRDGETRWLDLHWPDQVELYRRLAADGVPDSTVRSRYKIGPSLVGRLRATVADARRIEPVGFAAAAA